MALPEQISDETVELFNDLFSSPEVLEAATKVLRARASELTSTLHSHAVSALTNDEYRVVALKTEGRLLEVQRLMGIITRWTE